MAIEFVYTIYCNDVIEVPVIKDCPKLVKIKSGPYFGFSSILVKGKDRICITPEEAIDKHFSDMKSRVEIIEKQLERAKDSLKKAGDLRNSFTVKRFD